MNKKALRDILALNLQNLRMFYVHLGYKVKAWQLDSSCLAHSQCQACRWQKPLECVVMANKTVNLPKRNLSLNMSF